jgi:transcriptional regulator with AAA-type ATPase domain
VQGGQFRHDLYYRLNVIPIHAPALRAHIEDLPAIAAAILQQLARRDGLATVPTLTTAAVQRLQRHPFPGNVRELENLLERALALHPGPALDADAFDLAPSVPPASGDAAPPSTTARRATRQAPATTLRMRRAGHRAPLSTPKRPTPRCRERSSKPCCSATAGTSPAPRANWAGPWPNCATGCSAWGWGEHLRRQPPVPRRHILTSIFEVRVSRRPRQ